MTTSTINERALTRTQLRELKTELQRESERYAPEDPRAHAYAAALRRIEDGTYGSCASCGNPIPYPRLSVMPETSHCVGCSAH
jgi:RNA polymerase-binding transcription factor DksA